MKKTLLFLTMLLFSITQAQVNSVAVVGEAAGGWPGDPGNPGPEDVHQMATTDGVHWTLENLTLTTFGSGGGIKFRANNAWAINWGSTAFPSGTGTQNGQNIQCVAGVYDVTFNSDTGAYSFTNVVSFPSIGMIGTAVSADGFAGPDVDMVTFDGISYSVTNYNFLGGEMKFRQDDAWDINWGGTAFPSGVATINAGNNIPVPAGTYSVTFNRITGDYSFTFPSIGVIGTAVSAGGFTDPDTDLSTTDGVNYVLYNHTFTTGEAKFRQDNDWAVNWGSADFPSGTGTQDGSNIMVTAGMYTVHFNRQTGAYSFDAPVVFANIGVLGTAVTSGGFDDPDTNMTTNDGITYTLENYVFTNGELKFRQDDAWTTNWGVDLLNDNFPNGTAVQGGSNIPVVAGTYTLTFNLSTLAYSFVGTPLYPSVGILGTAVTANGFAGPDVNLSTNDGETYTLSNYTFTAGEAKFRQNDAWDINWGNPAFPSGVGTQGGNNMIIPAGTFNVTFTRSTGAYEFSTVGAFPSVGILGTAVDANGFSGPDTDLVTTNGIVYTLMNVTLMNGEAKFRQDDAWDINWGGSSFPSGLSDGNNIPVVAGTYDISFNRLTGAYNFMSINNFPSIGIIGDAVSADGFAGPDVDMQTTDGITYTLLAYTFVDGEAKFRQDDGWAVNWGSTTFPSGVGVQDDPNIPVVGGTYNVTFNILTGAYSFDFVSIGVLGTALTETNGFDGPDVNMSTSDGISYSLEIWMNAGEFKFRQNDSWTVNWGMGADMFEGIAVPDGPNFVTGGGDTMGIGFNRVTGEYIIVGLLVTVDEIPGVQFTAYPNPSHETWNIVSNGNLSSISVIDAMGKNVLTKNLFGNQGTVDCSSLAAGLYFAKVTSDKGVQTIKLIKK
ncbi:hypothetical protein HYN48_08020 [Flavobacterium magnum]|uniref:Secretion system C-terminal sorting domain-containing protein n=1 Tax=Flavobacterium magnum TaxID=2162713 RepID=A0A2S0RFK8_9FLAO|nr:T9SS type A sorting domain-containing protein [Flavobacterium magnum]AWA30028.1 hypothetical protein HYN48_08020 [Flavobacterium magnum]